jgi:hypothetical protein
MNRKYQFLFLGLLLFIAGLVLIPQGFLENLAHKYFAAQPANYLIQEVVGRVEKKSLGSTLFVATSAKSSVFSGDTIITHGDSKALFNFDTPFWLMPYSKMEFIKKDGAWIGHLIYGEIKKISTLSNNDKIDLVYEDKIIEEDQFSSSQDSNLIATVLPFNESSYNDISSGEAAPQNIIEKQIYQTLLLHKKFFQGCLVKYYKTKGGNITGGESVFDMTIDVTGAIEKTNITRTDIDDEEYLNCLKLVFSRIRFKNLPIKEPLHALFPLSVELPQ